MSIRYDNEFIVEPGYEHCFTSEETRELYKCSKDPLYFNKFLKIITLDSGKQPFVPYKYQKRFLKMCHRNRRIVALMARQSGKSTTVGAYALWYGIFHEDKYIAIASNKLKSAVNFMKRIKMMYEQLPVWLKPGIVKWNETMIEFDNGTIIEAGATTPDTFRGRSLNLLILDEFAFVPKGQAGDFWASNYPALSASKTSKIIIISTPNGMFNLFHQIYSKAERGENDFAHMKVTWKHVPGRDKKWAATEKKSLGLRKFNQEYEGIFLGSTSTVIKTDVMEILFTQIKDPILIDLEDRLRIYEKPKPGYIYVIGVDPSKGTGEHDACMQIIKINRFKPYVEMEQVAVFQDNMTDAYEQSNIINRLSIYYNNAFIICENNGEGSTVVNTLWWTYENGRLYNHGSKAKELGIRSTSTTKTKGVLAMKKIIEDAHFKLYDQQTLHQLSSFVEKSGKFMGQDLPDDLVDSLFWACYSVELSIFDEDPTVINKNEEDEDVWGILSDVDISNNWDWL